MKQFIQLLFIFILTVNNLCAKELVPSLREAERLYEKGFYSKSAEKAVEYIRFYPKDLQALIIAGMSYYHNGDYIDSVDMFVVADLIQHNNPIVTKYLKLLRELEYRSEPFTLDPELKSKVDPQKTAEFYKWAFWHPVTSAVSESIKGSGFMQPLEPYLMTVINEGRPVNLVTVLPPSVPAKMLTGEETLAAMATRALNDAQYLKSYLFYSQLNASSPKNEIYLVGKAESAFGLQRYSQVLDLLSHSFITNEVSLWPMNIRNKAELLVASARVKVYNK